MQVDEPTSSSVAATASSPYSHKNVLTIRTLQIQPMRNLVTALKDILTDATITFTKDGMKIINFDKTHTILVSVELYAKKFEFFECIPNKIVICTNTMYLFKLIQTMSNDDTLSIYIEKEDYHDGIVSHLGIELESRERNQAFRFKMKLYEPDSEDLVIPDVPYSTIINMPTIDFQKMIRVLHSLSERVEIKSVGDDILFNCVGSFAITNAFCGQAKDHMKFISKPDPSVIIQGEFSSKSLSDFIKCTPLCNNLEVYLENNLPLIVKYDVAGLGETKLCLAPLPPS